MPKVRDRIESQTKQPPSLGQLAHPASQRSSPAITQFTENEGEVH